MKLDLHVHTKFSADGSVEPQEYLKVARKIGLAGFAITDHNEITGAAKAFKLAKEKNELDLLVVRGVEISSDSGHILGYGITEAIPRGLTVQETIDKISDQGGVAVAAHPYRLASGLGGSVVEDAGFYNIEILNHRSPRHENNRARMLAENLKTGKTGGSDAHQLWELGLAATQFNIDCTTEDDVLSELEKLRSFTPVGESSTYIQGLKMYGKLVVHWLKRGLYRV